MIANPAKQGKDIRKSFTLNKVFGASATQGWLSFQSVENLLHACKVQSLKS